MGCKQSIPFKETRKDAIERPSPLSVPSYSETTGTHPSRQVAASQSGKDERGQNLHRHVTLRGSSTFGVGEATESHENSFKVPQSSSSSAKKAGASSVPPSLESHSGASADTDPTRAGSGKPCRRKAGVNSSEKEELSSEPPSQETDLSSCKFRNCRMPGRRQEAAISCRETRHAQAFLGSVPRDSKREQCRSANPGLLHVLEYRTEEEGFPISTTNLVKDTLQGMLPQHHKKCRDPSDSMGGPEEEPQNREEARCVARFQEVKRVEVSCTTPDIDSADRHSSSSDEETCCARRECDSSTAVNYSFIARPTPCRQPWELDADGRWTQTGVLPREKLIEVRRTPVPQQTTNQGSIPRRFRSPGHPGEAFPPGSASSLYFGIPGRRPPEGQFFPLTEQSHRACRAVALVYKAEKQRRASCGPTTGSYHPTGYVATNEAVASKFRELRAQKHTTAVPSTDSSPRFNRNQRREDGGAQGRYVAEWSGEDSGELRGEPTNGDLACCTEVHTALGDNLYYLRPGPQTGSQRSSASCTEAVQRSLAARRAAKNAFIAPPSTNMGPILQSCC